MSDSAHAYRHLCDAGFAVWDRLWDRAEEAAGILGDSEGCISGPGYDSNVKNRAAADYIAREFKREVSRFLQHLRLDDFTLADNTLAMPRWVACPWHQDHTYWDEVCSEQRTPFRVLVMAYLADVGPDDGAFQCIAGTHLKRHRMHDAHGESPGLYLDGHCSPSEITSVYGPAGTMFAADCRVLHRAGPRLNPGFRPALLVWADGRTYRTAVNRTRGPLA